MWPDSLEGHILAGKYLRQKYRGRNVPGVELSLVATEIGLNEIMILMKQAGHTNIAGNKEADRLAH